MQDIFYAVFKDFKLTFKLYIFNETLYIYKFKNICIINSNEKKLQNVINYS